MVKKVCVFCGSSEGVRPAYKTAAVSLAQYLVAREISVVYGGGNVGLMGVLADAVLAAHGEIIGVIPEALLAKEVAHHHLTDLHVVSSMHERKAMMADLADGFIALPGGYGTLDELCEILTWIQLGLQRKPCGLLNVEGYYNDLLLLFDHAVVEGFLKSAHRQIIISDHNPAALVDRLVEQRVPHVDKWINRQQT